MGKTTDNEATERYTRNVTENIKIAELITSTYDLDLYNISGQLNELASAITMAEIFYDPERLKALEVMSQVLEAVRQFANTCREVRNPAFGPYHYPGQPEDS